jgi:transcriptional regulator with XRE-family HTH domain
MPPDFGINDQNRQVMAGLRAEGMTLVEISRRFGISAQRVRRVLMKDKKVECRSLSVTCIECNSPIDSPAILRCDAGETLCLQCLARCSDPPFSRTLRALRLAAGMTRGQLAGRAGMSESTIGQYERGQGTPGHMVLKALARILGPQLICRDDGHSDTHSSESVLIPRNGKRYRK